MENPRNYKRETFEYSPLPDEMQKEANEEIRSIELRFGKGTFLLVAALISLTVALQALG